jgi:tetratricopeptide (TPR) repeat protein
MLAATDALIRAGLADAEPELLLGIESALPHQTVELRLRAAAVTRHLYQRLKSAMENGRDELKPEVARLANNLGGRLSDAGRRAEALVPAQEAVELYRALVRQNPDAFQPDLATSLNNLGQRGQSQIVTVLFGQRCFMARKLRIQYERAIYHVMNRGDRREAIFAGEGDRVLFLGTLAEACEKTGWRFHAYCLMIAHGL